MTTILGVDPQAPVTEPMHEPFRRMLARIAADVEAGRPLTGPWNEHAEEAMARAAAVAERRRMDREDG